MLRGRMLRPVPVLLCGALWLAPSFASAAIMLRGEDAGFLPGQRQLVLNIFAEAVPGDTENEMLFAYDIGFVLARASGGSTDPVRFAPPYAIKPSAEQFVFGDQPADFLIASSPAPTGTRFLLNVINNGTVLPDITSDPKKVAQVVIEVPGDFLPGLYEVRYDPELTAFGSGDPTRLDPAITTVLTDGALIVYVPEPAAPLLLGAAGLLALRRRRIVPA